jgi:prepilin-type N-terminal cleavage/methylation domain-containing protein
MRSLGFTLVEMLLASVLLSLLMMGVFAVVVAVARPAGRVAEVSPRVSGGSGMMPTVAGAKTDSAQAPVPLNDGVVDALVRLLREDLKHASSISCDEGGITLVGHGAVDAAGRAPTHRPARIEYRIETIDDRHWLIRRQFALDLLTTQNIQRDLVCVGVTSVDLVAVGDEKITRKNTPVTPSAPGQTEATATKRHGTTVAVHPGSEDASELETTGASVRETRPRPKMQRETVQQWGRNIVVWYPEGSTAIDWLRKGDPDNTVNDRSDDEGVTPPDHSTDTVADQSTQTSQAGTQPRGASETRQGRCAVAWRVRLWIDESTEPAYDRFVMVKGNTQ